MVKKFVLLAVVVIFALSACVTHTHVVGAGSQTGEEIVKAQWYILYGLMPLGEVVDTNEMAGGARDYTIVTQYTVVDALLSSIGNVVTLSRRTVKVIK